MNVENVPLPVSCHPVRLKSDWYDMCEYRIHSCDTLPPYARAEPIREVAKRLQTLRPGAGLWVNVQGQGKWYAEALRFALRKEFLPIVVTTSDQEPTLLDYRVLPASYPHKPPKPTFVMNPFDMTIYGRREQSKRRIISVLARLEVARTWEITSVSGLSHTYVRQLLDELKEADLVQPMMLDKYPAWEITRHGISSAYESWNIPRGMRFAPARREQRYAGQKHRHISRLWRWWLTEAYWCEIWDCWPEPFLEPAYPDALAWGEYCGAETLMWLEVDSGKKSRAEIAKTYTHRWQIAKALSDVYNIRLIFVLLAQPWVLDAARFSFSDIPRTMAVVVDDWRYKGSLAFPKFGEFNTTWHR